MELTLFNQYPLAELVVQHARTLAKHFAEQTDRDKTKQEVSKSQIRKFYQEFTHIRNNIGSNEYESGEIPLKLLISKAEYALSRKTDTGISPDFIKWFVGNIEAIKDKEHVKQFGVFFEAVIGFFYNELATQRNENATPRGGFHR